MRLWIFIFLGLQTLIFPPLGRAEGSCTSRASAKSVSEIYICNVDSEKVKFCSSKQSQCARVKIKDAENKLKSKFNSQSGYASRKLLRNLKRIQSSKKNEFLAYFDIMDWDKKVRVRSDFLVQTGPYGKLQVTDQLLKVKCLSEIMHAAYLLEENFPEISFQIDGDIRNCSNLKSGVIQLVENRSRVKKNISRFHSPMHTVYLTTQTKFNHFILGKMGLYVNVNRSKEIPSRLIEFRVGKSEITHETRKL